MKGSCGSRRRSARSSGAPRPAIAEVRGAAAGWALLETLPAEAVKTYQPYWALAAHLLQRMGRVGEAANAYSRAIGLCEDAAMRAFLSRRGRAKRRKGDRARIAPMRRRRKSQGGARTAVDRGRQRVVRSPQTCFS